MDTTVCEFRGPLHGVVLRQAEDGTLYTRRFNTRPELGYPTGEYEGDYAILTWEEAWEDFIERVRQCQWTTLGDLREMQEAEREE